MNKKSIKNMLFFMFCTFFLYNCAANKNFYNNDKNYLSTCLCDSVIKSYNDTILVIIDDDDDDWYQVDSVWYYKNDDKHKHTYIPFHHEIKISKEYVRFKKTKYYPMLINSVIDGYIRKTKDKFYISMPIGEKESLLFDFSSVGKDLENDNFRVYKTKLIDIKKINKDTFYVFDIEKTRYPIVIRDHFDRYRQMTIKNKQDIVEVVFSGGIKCVCNP